MSPDSDLPRHPGDSHAVLHRPCEAWGLSGAPFWSASLYKRKGQTWGEGDPDTEKVLKHAEGFLWSSLAPEPRMSLAAHHCLCFRTLPGGR